MNHIFHLDLNGDRLQFFSNVKPLHSFCQNTDPTKDIELYNWMQLELISKENLKRQ
ncbi:hypothetical protein [Chroococcidiopsis sp. SAG 2025]|uniref:hypothetical protein n=1 Tax=Chroococcidiopsis sp. SAG 2025 TaxID=171389 RepID=UPI002936ECE0|nr:hypothetical protein [Chroococcidiopsis sp. SAG 2025]